MQTKKHKIPMAIAGICLIGLIGFKDTGIFVKDYFSLTEDETEIVFNKEEQVNLIRETDKSFVIEKEGSKYEIPMDVLIRKDRTTQKYKVLDGTSILDKPLGNPIRFLNKDEIVQAIEFSGEYGYFTTEDEVKGYILLSHLEVIVEDNITYGISKVDKVLVDNDTYYTLIKGESVAIKDFKEDSFIILDDNGNEFRVNNDLIELRRTRETVSRSNVSRRASQINKVVEAAYNALGKPYVYGGTGPKGFDCSGLTYSVYLNTLNIKLNRSSRAQASNGVEVKKQDLIPGDLVFFRTSGKNIGHVGIYIGDGKMIHASSGRKQVLISPLDETYYKTRYVTARRIINN
ncbi:MAG: C40 family peptidase [Tissierellia bacterium]|nr:C40 family peptidase [Tissierellia bacterium]